MGAFSFITKLLTFLPRKLFAKRTMLLVTGSGIRTFTISPLFQFLSFSFLLWLAALFEQSMRYDAIIDSKLAEINKLKSINKYFEREFSALNDEVNKVNEYLKTISDDEYLVSSSLDEEGPFLIPEKIKNINLSNLNKKNVDHLRNIDSQIKDIELYAAGRISKIEDAIDVTGLSIKKMPKKNFLNEIVSTPIHNNSNLAQGGPLEEDDLINQEILNSASEYDLDRMLKKNNFKNKVGHLIFLENVIDSLPLERPMENFYVSSGFGYRTDPITKKRALHRGQDFVGPMHSEILSPSKGRVILAGKFFEYGNAIVIDHGFGVTTRYGHLYKIKVRKGQIVEKNQVIGLQGNSGRSTGHHLHYEVRYKNVALNPNKFINAGDKFFDDKSDDVNYIDS